MTRTILFVLATVLLLVPTYSGEGRLALFERQPGVRARLVALYPDDPARRRLGALTYLGGVELSGDNTAFGGFSSLAVDGDRFTLLSDGGNVVRFRLERGARLSDIAWLALPDGPGTGWSKLDRDSEGLIVDRGAGIAWVSFERANQIWVYDADLTRAIRHSAPPVMSDWPLNSGAEAIVRLSKGGFIAFSEGEPFGKTGAYEAARFSGDPTRNPRRGFSFGLRLPAQYRPTDSVELADGRILLLARRISIWDGFRCALFVIDPRQIRPGAVVEPREVARFEPPALSDNFEAMAVTREGASTILWIASDDNQTMFQKSLLLKFRLDLPAGD